MIRWTVAGLIVVSLLVGVVLLWPRDGSDPVSMTAPVAAAGSTTTTTEATTTTVPTTTTTSIPPTQVREVETVEQAEAILREYYFGWFEGIYNQDEERVREVVATSDQVTRAKEVFGVMEFEAPPDSSDILFSDTELLRADDDCLVVWAEVAVVEFRPGSTSGAHVFRWLDESWRLYSNWVHRNDLWEDDCLVRFSPDSS